MLLCFAVVWASSYIGIASNMNIYKGAIPLMDVGLRICGLCLAPQGCTLQLSCSTSFQLTSGKLHSRRSPQEPRPGHAQDY